MDDREFRQKLTPEQYRVMRQKGTETPHTGKYWDHDETGAYTCGACGNILFLSLNKVESDEGWPLFTRPARASAVALTPEGTRTELSCTRCGSHIGYRIAEKEWQVNSIALDFQELPDIDWDMDDGSGNSQQQQQSGTPQKTISLTIGGLTIGAVLGAGAVWAATPPQMTCPLSAAALQGTTTAQTGALSPPAAGTTRPAPGAVLSTQGAALPATSSAPAATSSPNSAGTSNPAATTTP